MKSCPTRVCSALGQCSRAGQMKNAHWKKEMDQTNGASMPFLFFFPLVRGLLLSPKRASLSGDQTDHGKSGERCRPLADSFCRVQYLERCAVLSEQRSTRSRGSLQGKRGVLIISFLLVHSEETAAAARLDMPFCMHDRSGALTATGMSGSKSVD